MAAENTIAVNETVLIVEIPKSKLDILYRISFQRGFDEYAGKEEIIPENRCKDLVKKYINDGMIGIIVSDGDGTKMDECFMDMGRVSGIASRFMKDSGIHELTTTFAEDLYDNQRMWNDVCSKEGASFMSPVTKMLEYNIKLGKLDSEFNKKVNSYAQILLKRI